MNRLALIQQSAVANSLKSYQTGYVLQVDREVGFAGKDVLEVGGSLPESFVLEGLGVKSWTAVEYVGYYDYCGFSYPGQSIDTSFEAIAAQKRFEVQPYQVINGKIEHLPFPLFSQFDLVFSIAALPFLHAIPMATEKIFQALKVGGCYCASASPIWSCYNGHVLTSIESASGEEYHFGNSPIPPWGHLLMNPPQMYDFLCRKTDRETAAKITYEVYNSQRANRFFLEDYREFVRLSPFSKGSFLPVFASPVPAEIQEKLTVLHPGYQNFSAQGFQLSLLRDRE